MIYNIKGLSMSKPESLQMLCERVKPTKGRVKKWIKLRLSLILRKKKRVGVNNWVHATGTESEFWSELGQSSEVKTQM